MHKITILLIITLFSLTSNSQKIFEGVITYQINYNKVPQEIAHMTDQLPSEMIVKYHDNKKRVETISKQSSKITITNLNTNKSFVLLTLFGEKIALVNNDETQQEGVLYDNCKIVPTEETKKIGKYKCKKSLLYFPKIKDPIIVYHTDEYKINDTKYKKLGGIPLEFTTTENGMLITYSMIDMKETKISDDEFEVDKAYTILTPEELQDQFGME